MKNILLAVTGLSPQVITETLYALHQNQQKVDAIHVITTRDGKEMIYAHLLGGKDGHYYKYMEEYGMDPAGIDFGYKNIHVIKDENGIEIPDISDEQDNERLLRLCLEITFELTKDPDTAVFFSIAGGRKTMSACLSVAVQMYGRAQDRMYHVLVSPEFENNKDFFYPPKESKLIELRDKNGNPVFKETKYARVNLIHIPFVSIRNQLSPEMLNKPMDPATLMLSLIKEPKSHLTVNLITRKIIYKGIELDMMPSWLAIYTFFVKTKKDCTKDTSECGSCIDCFLDIQGIYQSQDKITELYRRISGTRSITDMSKGGVTDLSQENFNMYKGKIKSAILNRFGSYALNELEIASIGTRPNTRYGIKLDKSRMEIVY